MAKKVKRDIHYHIRHKTKITFFFVFKVLLVFLISLIVFKVFYNYFLSAFGLLASWIISFIIAACLYLLLIIKVIEFLKF